MVFLLSTLAGCGGGGTSSSSTASAYTVGGTVSGLSGSLTLQDDGGDNLTLSSNGPFTFATPLPQGGLYSVTIASQPGGSTCAVSDGTGGVSAKVSTVLVQCYATPATGRWTWVSGFNVTDEAGAYGTAGTATSGSLPGARQAPSAWTDANGNFWLFGGYGFDYNANLGLLNDLWEYEPAVRQWVWMSGSESVGSNGNYGTQGQAAAANAPPARGGAASWTDSMGQLWLFGGISSQASGSAVEFNDLWRFQPATGQWTWMSGADTSNGAGSYGTQGVAASGNVPPARAFPTTWVDSAGVFWLFGGDQYGSSGVSAYFSDLWKYDPTSNLWTWVSGSSSPNAAGSYGTQGTAAPTNMPGSRAAAMAWIDTAGNLWMMGGQGKDQNGNTGGLNDLWRYGTTSGEWTWMAGAATQAASGNYGSRGVAAAGNVPGARSGASAWTDASGNFWLFGGDGYDQSGNGGDLSDLWEYNPGAGQWTWMGGSSLSQATGNYGTQGVAAPGNLPGAREQAARWIDGQGNLWLFGGLGIDSLGQQDDLSDLWSFAP
ncbi:MAG TPA: kelch repeat-containing protein [Steroidobacteraceae bacterium]|nr:kelch repeat-containing protein [Steroidobacteraceae bacterium]